MPLVTTFVYPFYSYMSDILSIVGNKPLHRQIIIMFLYNTFIKTHFPLLQ